MKLPRETLFQISEMICGDFPEESGAFRFRTGEALTEFFRACGTRFTHSGPVRSLWVARVLEEILSELPADAGAVPETLARVIRVLMDLRDATNEPAPRRVALAQLNFALRHEGLEGFYDEHGQCQLRHLASSTLGS